MIHVYGALVDYLLFLALVSFYLSVLCVFMCCSCYHCYCYC